MQIRLIADSIDNGFESVHFDVFLVRQEKTREYVMDDGKPGFEANDYELAYSMDNLKVPNGQDVFGTVYGLIDGTLAMEGLEVLKEKVMVHTDFPRSLMVGDVIAIRYGKDQAIKARVASLGFTLV